MKNDFNTNSEKPLIVQSDKTILLDVHSSAAEKCRAFLIPFAELERSPEHLHTYRLTPLSLWNAASAGFSAQDAISVLSEFSRYEIPKNVSEWIFETASRFGKLTLTQAAKINGEEYLFLNASDFLVWKEIESSAIAKKMLSKLGSAGETLIEMPENSFLLKLTDRGTVKQELLKLGWPVKDEVPLVDGEPLEINLRKKTLAGADFKIRDYQKDAVHALIGNKCPGTGFGTIVLPCGAGKTIVGMFAMSILKTSTLIITTNVTAVHQWISELKDKTDLTSEQIGEYTGENKTIKPVTIATYQILTWRPEKDGIYPHFSIFRERPWGLIIYDEVHMLPAPVFRVTAELQAIRRIGLTATLVREDGQEGNVFSLVGPKRYDVPWKDLESSGFIASAECIEVRVDFSPQKAMEYAVAEPRQKHRIASENPAKLEIAQKLISQNPNDKILVIGQYLSQLEILAKKINAPIITGKTANNERDKLYTKFRQGEIRVLVVSKVANFAVDLPDASMAIQISGTFGSRQEEAQRLGRILRPKERTSRFWTLITRNTVEEDFGSNRRKFLTEQGYSYSIIRSFDDLKK